MWVILLLMALMNTLWTWRDYAYKETFISAKTKELDKKHGSMWYHVDDATEHWEYHVGIGAACSLVCWVAFIHEVVS